MPTIRAIHPSAAGLSAEHASEVFDHIAQFASYGFNKSHAAAYAVIGFETAALKAHHAPEFMAAAMNMAIGEVKDLAVFAGQLKARAIPILAPHVNMCAARFAPIQGKTKRGVAYALAALRGVGMAAATAIEAERTANGRFTSLADFKTRMHGQIDKKATVSLIQAGAFDGLVASRADGVALAEERGGQVSVHQMSLFDTAPGIDTRTPLPEWSRAELLDREFDALGFWLSGHPLESFRPTRGAKPLTFVGALRGREHLPRQADIVASVVDWETKGTKSGKMMAILTLSDADETFEAVAFEEEWAGMRDLIRKKATLAFTVQPGKDGDDLRITLTGAQPYTAPGLKKAA